MIRKATEYPPSQKPHFPGQKHPCLPVLLPETGFSRLDQGYDAPHVRREPLPLAHQPRCHEALHSSDVRGRSALNEAYPGRLMFPHVQCVRGTLFTQLLRDSKPFTKAVLSNAQVVLAPYGAPGVL